MNEERLKQFLIDLMYGISNGNAHFNENAFIDLIVGLGSSKGIFKDRQFIVLDINGNPMDNQYELDNGQDAGQTAMSQFKSLKEAQDFMDRLNKSLGKSNPAWKILELKEVNN